MKTVEDILEFLAFQIHNIYRRLGMYGNNAGELDMLLWAYHDLKAECESRREDFSNLVSEIMERERTGGYHMIDHYRRQAGDTYTDAAGTEVVYRYWQEIDRGLGWDFHDPAIADRYFARDKANEPRVE